MHASVSPLAMTLIQQLCPDVVIYNKSINSVVLIKLICTLDSIPYSESARDCKQTKEDYLQILSRGLGTLSYYNTIEISVLGHYLQSFLSSLCNVFIVSSKLQCFQDLGIERFLVKLLNYSFMCVSRRIFVARNCAEWSAM